MPDELIGGVDDERWKVRLKNRFFGSLTILKSSIFLEVGLTSGQASDCCLFLFFLPLPLATGAVVSAVVGTSFDSVGIAPSDPIAFLPDSRFESERLNVADIRALSRDKEKRWKRGGFLLFDDVDVVVVVVVVPV